MRSLVDFVHVELSVDFCWDDRGIVRLPGDFAALQVGDFSGLVLLYCHGNGEGCCSSRKLFEALASHGFSVLSVDYRGYGLSGGRFSEKGCYDAVHAGVPGDSFARKVHCPVLAFHGTMDFVVPYADGKDLFDCIESADKRLVTVPSGGHNDFQVVMGWPKYVDELVFFCNKLKGSDWVGRGRLIGCT